MNTKEWKFKDGQETSALKKENEHLKEQIDEIKKENKRLENFFLKSCIRKYIDLEEIVFKERLLKRKTILFFRYDDYLDGVSVLFLHNGKLFELNTTYDCLENKWEMKEIKIKEVEKRLKLVFKDLKKNELQSRKNTQKG